MKEILVSGGAGFLGSHLCRRLLAEGSRVTCLDNFFTGAIDHLEEILHHPNFLLKERDVQTPFDCCVDEIYNLACPASPIHYQRDPILTCKTSVLGALNMLELAARQGAVIFQASTSEVYGDPTEHPQKESYWGHVNPIGIRACYDEGKRVAETLFFDFHRSLNVSIRVGRIFNTFGPRMKLDDGRVVSTLILQALKNEPLTLFGDGTQTRSFCYVDDLIEGILLLTRSQETGPINLGNDQECSLLELAEVIKEECNSSSPLQFAPLPGDDPKKRRPDLSKAKQNLGFEPKVSLREGVKKTIAYFDALLTSQASHK